MITNFRAGMPLEPVNDGRFQWLPALGAGCIAGLILLVVPRGSPWSALNFFTPVILGRMVSTRLGLPCAGAMLIHLAASLLYGLGISRAAASFTRLRPVLTGAVVGLLLYLFNLAIVSLWLPGLRGAEFSVMFTHVVFGLIAGGAYRGLLRRKAADSTNHQQ